MSDELNIPKEESGTSTSEFVDIGRLKLNRKKQQQGIESLKSLLNDGDHKVRPVFAGAAISGLFAIFYDGYDYFRIKNISDSVEARKLLRSVGLDVCGTVPSMKQTAKNSLAKSDKRSNIV